jgi:sortase (surface protein transpeptidase)
LPRSLPLSISIPAIGVQSNLLTLGRTAGGRRPCRLRRSWSAIFYRLGALKRGDSVHIRRSDGRVATFTVNDVRRYSKQAFPTALVYGNTNRAALRLITCGGPFDASTGSYEDNVIVWASLASVAAG